MNNDIFHDEQNQRFILAVEGKNAQLDYRLANESGQEKGGTIDFVHTYVPEELRGRGHAERLVRHGLKWAKEQDYTIHASCWYAAKFLRQHSA